MNKRITFFLVAAFLLLAMIPAFYPVEDEALRENGFFSYSYAQLLTAAIAFYDFGFNLYSLTTDSSIDPPCILSNAFPETSETRAPPA